MSQSYTPSHPQPNTLKTDVAGKAKEVLGDVKQKASDVNDNLTKAVKDNAAQLGDTALTYANTAKDKVGEVVTQRKSVGADYIGSIAHATGQAAAAFESDLPQAAQYIRNASSQLQGVADSVRDRDVRELVSDVQDFARKQPTLFFGGAVLLGFAALRFFKSTPPQKDNSSEGRNGSLDSSHKD